LPLRHRRIGLSARTPSSTPSLTAGQAMIKQFTQLECQARKRTRYEGPDQALPEEVTLRVISPRPPRRGPGKLPRTLVGSLARAAQWYPVPVFLVEHPSQGPFLIDVGYDPSIASDPTRTLGLVFGKVAMRHRLAERSVPEQVARRGVDPAEISLVVMTHLHNDHVSGSAQWPQATFVVDGAERVAAARRAAGPYVRSHLARIERWREIDYAGAEPFESFGRTVDLFGDGLVRLVSSPGIPSDTNRCCCDCVTATR
jgi:hypothetical protein